MIAILTKVTLVCLLALAAVRCLRRGSAAMRHLVCSSALLASGLMPLMLLVPPRLEVLRVPFVISTEAVARVSAAAWLPGALPAWIWTSAWAWIWATGSLLVLARVAVGFWRVQRVRRPARQIGAEGSVQVLEAGVTVPVAVGLLRPAILIPAGAAEWPEAYRMAALRHEAAHIGRRDLWTNLLAHLVCAAYWFHPLVWAVARKLREEQELACDDVAVLSGTPPEMYAEALVAAARSLRPQSITSMIGCHMVTNNSLRNRIARLVDVNLPRTSSSSALRRVALASAGVALCVGLLTAQPPTPVPAPGKVYKMGDGIKAPKLLAKVDPEYTQEARAAKIDGTVQLSLVIGTDGLAHDINVVRGLDGGLDVKAVEAVQKWHFEPGTRDGEPVQVQATIEINFKIK